MIPNATAVRHLKRQYYCGIRLNRLRKTTATCSRKAGIAEPEKPSTVRQHLRKHVLATMNMHSTIWELL
jgi:hypothetical protein